MKHVILLFLFCCSMSPIFAQFEDPEQICSRMPIAHYIFTNDIDNDNDLDILMYDFFTGFVSWSENSYPDDYFKPAKFLANTGDEFKEGDIDGDGDIDFSYRSAGNIFNWVENLGNFNFSDHELLNRDDFINSIFWFDIEGDGDLDMFVVAPPSSGYKREISWYENLDGINFGSINIISQELTTIKDMGMADLDNDGDMDLVASSQDDGKILWYENQTGVGDFTSGSVVALLVDAAKIELEDIDSDGHIDVVARSKELGKFVWYKNLGGIVAFSPQQDLIFSEGYRHFELVDMDTDGDQDIVISSNSTSDNDDMKWYENEGGNFSQHLIFSHLVEAFAISDMNKDGQLDILSSPLNGIYFSKGIDNASSFEQNRLLDYPINNYCDVAAGDIDGDGSKEIVIAGRGLYVKGVDKIEPLQLQANIPFISHGIFPYHIVDLKDVDADGDLDVIYDYGANNLAWRSNDGNGIFSDEQEIATTDFSEFKVVDMDCDGDLDIVSTKSGLLWWPFENGQYSSPNVIFQSTPTNRAKIETGDMDNDGDIDIVFATGDDLDLGIVWFENLDGFGANFSAPIAITDEIQNFTNLKLGDFNGDELLDIVAMNGRGVGGKLFLISSLENDGFSNPVELTYEIPDEFTPPVALGLDIGDIDQDGDLDILTSDGAFNSSTIFWFNNENGISEDIVVVDLYTGLSNVLYLNDIDQDGDLDFMRGYEWANAMFYFRNNTNMLPDISEEEFVPEGFSVYPNPAIDYLVIESTFDSTVMAELELYDVKGRLIHKKEVCFSNINQSRLNLEHIPAGFYFLNIEYNGESRVEKVIIH